MNLSERQAVLAEVEEMLEEMRVEWEHLDSAEQALRAARDEIHRRREATYQMQRDPGRRKA